MLIRNTVVIYLTFFLIAELYKFHLELGVVVGNAKSIGIIFVLCLLFSYLNFCLVQGAPWDKWLMPLLSAGYYTLITGAIYLSTVSVFKSPIAFMVVSWIAVATLFVAGLFNAQSADLTWRLSGFDLFIKGDVTALGIVYQLLDPVLFLAFFATSTLWRGRNNHKKEKL